MSQLDVVLSWLIDFIYNSRNWMSQLDYARAREGVKIYNSRNWMSQLDGLESRTLHSYIYNSRNWMSQLDKEALGKDGHKSTIVEIEWVN